MAMIFFHFIAFQALCNSSIIQMEKFHQRLISCLQDTLKIKMGYIKKKNKALAIVKNRKITTRRGNNKRVHQKVSEPC